MKFRMFTVKDGEELVKIAVNVDKVVMVEDWKTYTSIGFEVGGSVSVVEDYHTVISRLNTIAE